MTDYQNIAVKSEVPWRRIEDSFKDLLAFCEVLADQLFNKKCPGKET